MNDEIAGKLAEFELLSKSMKQKKQEIKKAIFYAKHPQLRMAKEEVEKVKEPAVKEPAVKEPAVKDAAEIFNRTLQEQVKEPVKETVKDIEKPAVKDVEKPAVKEPVKEPVKEQVVQQGPVVVTLGGKWF